jgi:AcrR family transcriptional regulator
MIAKHAVEPPDISLHRQKRARLTRRALLRSAKTIFARDGFEHARIEDIASRAGKTRGAFYDNFKDKEDVFFAMFEESIDRDLAELGPMLRVLPSIEKRVEALGEYLRRLSKDRERVLLNLEFKLYAIRHPRRRKRLVDLHAVMRLRYSIPELNQLLPEAAGLSGGVELSDSFAICGIMDGLSLNHLFDPDTFDDGEVGRYLKLCLREALTGASKQKIHKTA